MWNKVPKFKNGCPPFYETQRNNVRILIEKIGEKIDPCKVYPLAGPCQLVHCHYKCTVYYDELYWSDYPIPFNHVDHKVEVVYFDKDHLRRCGGPEQAGDSASLISTDRAGIHREGTGSQGMMLGEPVPFDVWTTPERHQRFLHRAAQILIVARRTGRSSSALPGSAESHTHKSRSSRRT